MATWGVHLRIAGRFLDRVPKEYHKEFVTGTVAPDCGYGKKDSEGEFEPPPTVTHWSPTGAKNDCRYKDFKAQYVTGASGGDYWFYLGYYLHLMTDIMWSVTMYMPTRIKYREQYDKNPHFLSVIKRDWNEIDAAYLQKSKRHPVYDILTTVTEVKDYLPYYEKGQLTAQIKFITDYYTNYEEVPDREYIYTRPEEIENFIECASYLLKLIAEREKLL